MNQQGSVSGPFKNCFAKLFPELKSGDSIGMKLNRLYGILSFSHNQGSWQPVFSHEELESGTFNFYVSLSSIPANSEVIFTLEGPVRAYPE